MRSYWCLGDHLTKAKLRIFKTIYKVAPFVPLPPEVTISSPASSKSSSPLLAAKQYFANFDYKVCTVFTLIPRNGISSISFIQVQLCTSTDYNKKTVVIRQRTRALQARDCLLPMAEADADGCGQFSCSVSRSETVAIEEGTKVCQAGDC
ncbi:MAG: hypothetical protein P8X78_02135 [Nitrosopumilaceae archaeon]